MPMIAMAGAAVAGPIIGGIMGNQAAKKDREAAKQAMKQAIAALDAVGMPPDLSKEIIMREFQKQGVYNPQVEEDLSDTFAESQMAKVQEDPGLKQAQMQALASMQNRAKVGLSAEDRASLNQVRSEVQRDAEAKRQQVLQQMQSRGMGGSGAALIAQLQAGQSGADLASQQSDQVMAQAQQRALQALGQSGQMAGQMQEAQFGRQADIAKSVDERNRFLQENSIARQSRNVGALNQAQQLNLVEQQRIADANIQLANAEKLRQSQAQGEYWDRKLGYGQAKASAYTGTAQAAQQRAANTAQSYANMGAGVGSAATAMGTATPGTTTTKNGVTTTTGGSGFGNLFGSDENMKQNIDESGDEVQSFMDRIAKKYLKD